jgi:biotin-(acetyl-CoA carboxylase) ligase
LVITYGYFFDKPLYYSNYQGTGKYHSNKYLTYQKVSNYLLEIVKKEKSTTIIVSGIGANVINYNLNQKNKNIKLSKFSHSCFYSSKYEVEVYNTLFEEELQNADILVVSDSDLCYQISFHYNTTYYILKDRFAEDFNEFTQIKKIGEFRILRKNKLNFKVNDYDKKNQ